MYVTDRHGVAGALQRRIDLKAEQINLVCRSPALQLLALVSSAKARSAWRQHPAVTPRRAFRETSTPDTSYCQAISIDWRLGPQNRFRKSGTEAVVFVQPYEALRKV